MRNRFSKRVQRAISLFLVNAMIVSSCPTYAFAEALDSASDAVGNVRISDEAGSLGYVSKDGVKALRVDSEKLSDPETIESWLVSEKVKKTTATDMAVRVLSDTDLGEAAPTMERQGDGSNIEALSLAWVTQDTVDNGDAALLYLKPVDDATQQVRMRLNYALSGEFPYNAGDVRISVPVSMFHNRDGSDAGKLLIPYPESPSTAQDFNYERVGDRYVITNTRKLSAATKGFIEFAIIDLTPHKIPDMQISDEFDATIEVTTHRNNVIGLVSNPLTARIDTEAALDGAYKRLTGHVQWVNSDAIPAAQRVEGETEYVMVTYYIYDHRYANTEFFVDAVDAIQDEYHGFVIGNTEDNGGVKHYDRMFEGYQSTGNGEYLTVKVAYPGSQFEPDTDYVFKNKITYTLTEVDPEIDGDPQKVTEQSAVATVPFRWHMPVFVPPTGHFMFNKIGNDGAYGHDKAPYWSRSTRYNSMGYYKNLDVTGGYGVFHNTDDGYGIYPSALNDLRDGSDVELGYTIEPQGYLAPWTLDGDSRLVESYGKKPVTMVSYDTDPTSDTLYLTGGEELEWGTDWTYTAVEFPIKPSIGKLNGVNVNPDGSFTAVHAGDSTFNYGYDSDDSHQPPISIEAEINGEWKVVATADWRNASNPLTVSNGAVLDGKRIVLPAGTRHIRSTVVSTNAYIWYYLRPIVTLHPTEHVTGIVEELFADSYSPSTSVYNTGSMQAYDAAGSEIVAFHKTGRDDVNGYSTDIAVYPTKRGSQSLVDVDYEKRQVTVHYSLGVEERSLIGDRQIYDQAVADGRITQDRHGVFYDLLPVGVTPLPSTVKLRNKDKVIEAYTVEDWRGSGRTMLIVEAELTPAPSEYAYSGTYDRRIMDKLSLTFDAIYGFDSLRDYGQNIHNVFGYESLTQDELGTVPDYRAEADDPRGTNNIVTKQAFVDNDEATLFENLDDNRDTQSFVYAGTTTKIDALGVARTSLSKDVMTNNDGVWSQGTYDDHRLVYEGGQYSYRIRMMSDSNTITKDIVLYDSLENFYAADGNDEVDIDAPRWRGFFRSIDLSQIRKMGVAPVLYYTTTDQVQIADESDPDEVNHVSCDLSNRNIWIPASEYTGSLDDIHGFAVDCRKTPTGEDFELDEMQSLVALVRMQAPDGDAAREYISQKGAWGDSAHAYNNIYMIATSLDRETRIGSHDTLVRNDYTKVGLMEHNYTVTKSWVDDGDRDGLRQDHVVVHLLANGEDTGRELRLDDSNEWTAAFEHIPYTDPDGNKIRYTVREDSVEGYDTSVTKNDTSMTVVNSHDPEKISISGTKTWVDTPEEAMPSYIQVNLYADDAKIASKIVKPDTKGDWEYSFTDLNKYRDHGTLVNYRVDETMPNNLFVADVDGYDIQNTYHPYGDLVVSKSVVGATDAFAGRDFDVSIVFTDSNGGPVSDEFDWTSTDGTSGKVSTGGTLHISDGESITVKEIPDGVTYEVIEADAPGYTLSADGITGTIVANDTKQANLTNTYSAEGSVQVMVDKSLTGRDMTRYQFKFELVDDDGNVVRTGSNQANGTVTFGLIPYVTADAGKTYHYTIREQDRGIGGYTYDTAEYGITVAVSDNGDGTLSTDVSYEDASGHEIERPSFENVYEADGSTRLRAWKRLTGATLEANQFDFEFMDATGTVVSSVHNSVAGDVYSDEISYDETDDGKTHLYVVHEVAGDDEHVIYDESYFGYLVHVTDNGDGTLSITQDYTNVEFDDEHNVWVVAEGDPEVPVFMNDMKPGELVIRKHVTGEVPDENMSDEFHFKVQLVGDNLPENIEYEIRHINDMNSAPIVDPNLSVIGGLFDWLFGPTKAYAADIVTTYDGNGGYFYGDPTKTQNVVTNPIITKISHTANLTDDGTKISDYTNSGSNTYIVGSDRAAGNSSAHVVTIPGADRLQVEVEYGGEGVSLDWVRVFAGAHPDFTASSTGSDVIASLGGKHGKQTYTVEGDSVTFAWRTDGSVAGDGFGYYAVVSGASVDAPYRSGYAFSGWNTARDGSGDSVGFVDGGTLYAQWSDDVVIFDANGGTFESSNSDKLFGFKVDGGGAFGQVVSHSDNMTDTGQRTVAYRSNHSSRTYEWETVSIPGAKGLSVDYRYGTNWRYDTLYVVTGSVDTPSDVSNTSSGPNVPGSVAKLFSAGSNTGIANYSIAGDSATFGLWFSPYSSSAYASSNELNDIGWYAKVIATDSVVKGDVIESPVRLGYRFIGWNTALDGSGEWYTDGDDTMYAQWLDTHGTCGGVSYYVDDTDTLVFYPTNGVSGEFERPEDGTWPWDDLISNRSNVHGVKVLDGVIGCSDMSYFLGHHSNRTIESIDVSAMDVSHVTNMSHMFRDLNNLYSLDVSGWDTSHVTDMNHIFYNLPGLVSLDLRGWDTSNVTNMSYAFYGMSHINNFDIRGLDTSKVTDFSYAFSNMRGIDVSDSGLSDLDTSSAINMRHIMSSSRFTNLDVSSWDVSHVTTFDHAFYSGPTFMTGLSSWNSSSAETMSWMFYNNSVISNEVKGLDTTNATNLSHMFRAAQFYDVADDDTHVRSDQVDLRTYDVRNVTDMSYMFGENTGHATEILIDGWDTSHVTNMDRMFFGSDSSFNTTYCDLSKLDVSSVTNFDHMFYSNSSFKTVDLSNWNMASASNTNSMIGTARPGSAVAYGPSHGRATTKIVFGENCKAISANTVAYSGQSVDGKWRRIDETETITGAELSGLYTSDNERFVGTWVVGTQAAVAVLDETGTLTFVIPNETFDAEDPENTIHTITSIGGKEYTGYVDVDYLGSNVNYTSYVFGNRKDDVKHIVVDEDSVVKFTYPNAMGSYFNGYKNLETFDGKRMDMSNQTTMASMFANDPKLTTVDFSGWNTSNVTSFSSMFSGDKLLSDFDLSNLDPTNVTTMASMFYNCDSLANPDFSSWSDRLGNVTTMASMFNSCDSLVHPVFNEWDLPKLTDMGSMFYDCDGKLDLDFSDWNTPALTNLYSTFYSCSDIQSLDVSGLDTGNVTNMQYTFSGIGNSSGAMIDLDLSSWDVSKVLTFGYNGSSSGYGMFSGATCIKDLDLSSWHPDSAVSFTNMFSSMSNLETLDISGFTIGDNAYRYNMFYNDGKLKSVTLGMGFDFESSTVTDNNRTSSPYFYRTCVLPTPPSSTTTGKWVNLEKDPDQRNALTPTELRANYDGTDDTHVGTWVWQMSQKEFVFNANGGMGSMPHQIIAKGTVGNLNAPMFTLFDHDFVEWNTEPDGSGQSYQALQRIQVTGSDNEVIQLYAIWRQRDHSVDIEDGTFYVDVPIDCELVITGLPSGVGYVVTETGATHAGWSLDSQEGGTGSILSLETDTADFTNKYTPNEAQAIIVASKTMNGEGADAGMFKFRLAEGDTVIQETENVAGGGIIFDPIVYTAAGDHTYTLTEVPGNDSTITYDDTEYTVQVHVTRNADNIMTASVDYGTTGNREPLFSNSRKPGSLRLVKETVGVRAEGEHDVFQYTVTIKDAKCLPVGSVKVGDTTVSNANGIYVIDITDEAPVVISELPAGSTYEVVESRMGNGWSVESDSGLTGTIASTQTSVASVTNRYTASGEAVIQAWKQLHGRVAASGEFSFTLYDSDGQAIDTVTNAAVDTRDTVVGADGETMVANEHRGQASVTFASLTYDTPGVYEYTIRENAGNDVSVDYDNTSVKVIVTVTDAGGGQLACSVAYEGDDYLFENVVVPGSLELHKGTYGATESASDAKFTYMVRLSDAAGEAVPDATYSGTINGASAPFDFVGGTTSVDMHDGDIVRIDGIAHDTRYVVTESMEPCWSERSSENTAGTITRETVAEASFVNEYSASGSFVVEADKRVENLTLKDGDYSFTLTDDTGTVVSRASNNASGHIVFEELPLDLSWVGVTKTYTIRETPGDNARILYDDHAETVTITTTDDGHGNLMAAISYDDDGAVFVNKDNPGYLKATKVCGLEELIGNPDYSVAGAEYEVIDTSNEVVGTLVVGEDGITNTLELTPGAYFVRETKAPTGFSVDVAKHRVTVVGGQTASPAFTDEPLLGSLELTKVSDRPEITNGVAAFSLAGARYGVYKTRADAEAAQRGEDIESYREIVTEQTEESFAFGSCDGLPKGTYFVVELEAPANYKVDSTIYECEVDYGKTVSVNGDHVVDEVAAGYISIKKVFGA